jgi:hypothetical protein
MKRSLAACLFVTAGILGTVAAFAQDAQTPPQAAQSPTGSAFRDIMTAEYSQETLDLALKLVQITGTSRTFNELLPNIADQAKNNFIRANPQMQLGIIEVVDRVALSLVSRRPQLDQMLARVWASGFTNEEMQQLIEFYSSDVGQKYANLHPQLLTVEMATAEAWGRSLLTELTQKVQAELRATMAAEQQSLQGDVAAPAPAAPQPDLQAAPQQPDLGGALAPVQ